MRSNEPVAAGSLPRAATMRPGPSRLERRWKWLAIAWALYYFLAYSLGRYEQYMRKTIWIGGAVAVALALPLVWQRVRQLPREAALLVAFAVWTLTGFWYVTDMTAFARYQQLIWELAVVVICVSLILANSGGVKWFYLSFLGSAVVCVVLGVQEMGWEALSDTAGIREAGLAQGPNALGFYSFMGILGILGFLGEMKGLSPGNLLRAGGLIAGGGVAIYGIVISASRGAFAALLAVAGLWPVLCLMDRMQKKWSGMAKSLFVGILVYGLFRFVIEYTFLGERLTRASHMEDNSTVTRVDLVSIAVELFTANPLIGVGVGQFGDASGTGYYAHNEFAEILATTGLPGFCLYYSVYLIAWLRLSRSLRLLRDPVARYRVNFARLILLALLISGMSRPNFLAVDSMFLLAVATGISLWAEQTARASLRRGGLAGLRTVVQGAHPPPYRAQGYGRHTAAGRSAGSEARGTD